MFNVEESAQHIRLAHGELYRDGMATQPEERIQHLDINEPNKAQFDSIMLQWQATFLGVFNKESDPEEFEELLKKFSSVLWETELIYFQGPITTRQFINCAKKLQNEMKNCHMKEPATALLILRERIDGKSKNGKKNLNTTRYSLSITTNRKSYYGLWRIQMA